MIVYHFLLINKFLLDYQLLFDEFNNELKKYIEVKTGKFGADMEVSITNVGPTTIWLER